MLQNSKRKINPESLYKNTKYIQKKLTEYKQDFSIYKRKVVT